jgi:hypothetical protein
MIHPGRGLLRQLVAAKLLEAGGGLRGGQAVVVVGVDDGNFFVATHCEIKTDTLQQHRSQLVDLARPPRHGGKNTRECS